MTVESIEELLAANLPRMLADGVEYVDIMKTAKNVKTVDEWCNAWIGLAAEYEQAAVAALNNGRSLTAGELFWRASLYNHYGQFMVWHNDELKGRAVKKKVETYNRGAPLFRPSAERVEVGFENAVLPGFLRLPTGSKRPPCVVLIGGLESTKEEYYAFENVLLRRGLATFAFDGPGQGEVTEKMKSRPDFEKATSKVIDYLVHRPEIDPERIGVLGRSLGGHYSARSAAFDRRIKACVAWGAVYDFSTWDAIPAGHKDGWTYTSGKKDWNEAKQHYANYTLSGAAEKITCPLCSSGEARPDFQT